MHVCFRKSIMLSSTVSSGSGAGCAGCPISCLFAPLHSSPSFPNGQQHSCANRVNITHSCAPSPGWPESVNSANWLMLAYCNSGQQLYQQQVMISVNYYSHAGVKQSSRKTTKQFLHKMEKETSVGTTANHLGIPVVQK